MAENLPEPKSRKESYLAKAAGMSVEVPEKPESRTEQYLAAIAEGGGGGGGGSYTAGDGITIENNTISADLVQYAGSSTTQIMSQKAVTDNIYNAKSIKYINDLPFNYPENNPDGYIIGDLFSWQEIYYAAENSVKLYYSENDYINFSGYLQAGLCDYSFDDYEIYTYGFTITKLNGTSNTPEIYVGQTQYIPEHWDETLEDDVPASWTSLSFEQVGAGGGGPTVVQTTGTSTTDVMSQNAVTGMVFADAGTNTKVRIGTNRDVSQNGIVIGVGAYGNNSGSNEVVIGHSAHSVSDYDGIAIGNLASITPHSAIALGRSATVDSGCQGGIALGAYSRATRAGELNIGTSWNATGFNNTAYRLIAGVHDGQAAHDAATVAQGNTLASSAPTTSTEGVLGQLWTDTTNMHTYQCTAISGSTYTWTQRW